MPIVQSLFVYPVKSCAGIALETATVLPSGLEHDREWMLIDPHRIFLTQREIPKLAHIVPSLDSGQLTLNASTMPSITVEEGNQPAQYDAFVWESKVSVLDAGDDAASWFTSVVGQPVRLVRMAPDAIRPVGADFARTPTDNVKLADGYPILVIVQESLDDLNLRMPDALPMQRFRPNIVISGSDPYADDEWQSLAFPDLSLDLVKPSSRCVITQTDQETLKVGKDPLKTLAGYRRQGSRVLFGWNAIPRAAGSVTIGQSIHVTEVRVSLFA